MQRELVIRAKAGDHEAFARLVDGSLDRLFTLAVLILHDADRAQDAVQEALVSAWRDLRALRDPDAWDAWIHRLTVWSCYRLAKRERRRDVIEARAAAEMPEVSGDLMLPLVERDRLEGALARLPVEQRAVLVAHFYLGSTMTEVADILGIPAGTAKSRLHRGLEGLRAELAEDRRRP
jgi:RNA polymerase sigma-70 factor (ECF subfamily)